MKRNIFNLNEHFESLLQEGVHDKAIFKAVFLAGGPGSGKDYVLKHTLDGHGLTEISSDKAYDHLMDKENLNKEIPEDEEEARKHLKKRVKSTNDLRHTLAFNGRNGLIINGTGDDHQKVKKIKRELEKIGYDTHMIMVNTSDEVSKQRNIERSQKGGRPVPENTVRKPKWDAVQAARQEHAKEFGNNYIEFDNNEDLRTAPPEVVKQKKEELSAIRDRIKDFVNTPPSNENVTKKWISKQVEKSSKLPIPRKGSTTLPHPESNAGQQAAEAGLHHYGQGRFGKNGKVTHYSLHDNLTEIKPDKPNTKKTKINENFSNLINKVLTEGYSFSDESDLLTLGTKVDVVDFTQQKGNEYVQMDNESVFEERTDNQTSRVTSTGKTRSLYSDYRRNRKQTCSEETSITETTKEKILQEEVSQHETKTLSNFRQKIKESIDKGIESGMSMASSGENLTRDADKKANKKKEPPLEENIGDSGEMINTISAQKEDELKKKGISLSSFKSKRPI